LRYRLFVSGFLAVFSLQLILSPAVADQAARYLPYGPLTISPLQLRLGFGDAVTPIARAAQSSKGAPCAGSGEVPLTKFLTGENDDRFDDRFCVSASTDGIIVHFYAPVPFVTAGKLLCVHLNGPAGAPAGSLLTVIARAGRNVAGNVVYDGGRAECNAGTGFTYALSAETQSVSNLVAAGFDGKRNIRTMMIPWKLLRVGAHTSKIMVAVNVCQPMLDCKSDMTEIEIPVVIVDSSFSLSAQYAPYGVIEMPAQAPATPVRLHQIGVDGTYSWDRHDVIMASFAQDQSAVGTQKALSEALALTPLAIPMVAPQMETSQTLQTRSQSLFAFQKASGSLSDQSLKSFFDTQPYSVNKLGSLSSGYVYGYDSEQINVAAVYGNQAPGVYSGAESVTFVLPTPLPSPEPSPQPRPPGITKTGAEQLPLRPPPVPVPFVEANTANDPPLQLGFLNSYVGSKGTRDAVNAFSARGHIFSNETATYEGYDALTADLFGEIQESLTSGIGSRSAESTSNFFGESATLTSSTAGDEHQSFLQVRETVGDQVDDDTFAPSAGAVTWLAPLSGPVVHVAASTAQGKSGRFYALDLFGFRLSNRFADFASEEGIQGTIPVPRLTGWLVTGGTQTQVVSDRIAALDQGLASTYSTAIPEVLPTAAAGSIAFSTRRTQLLGNVSLQSPWQTLVFSALKFQAVAGFNSGTVTGCNTAPNAPSAKVLYQCGLEPTNHIVGGAFFQVGKEVNFGVTDTPALSSNVGNSGSASHNVGSTGGLPGSVTAYFTYTGCPKIALSYANAAFPSGIPLPQQGSTISSEFDYPVNVHAEQIDVALGYYNERTAFSTAPSSSGAFAAIHFGVENPAPAKGCVTH
jgi:hypothetical protein